MKWKADKPVESISPCADMIGSDLRRYWLLPAAAFLLLVIFVLMPDLAQIQQMQRGNPLQDSSPLFPVVAAALPVLVSACVFSWLHNRRMAARLHSLPLTRTQHFFSHLISGWILSVLPFLLLFIIYMLMMKYSDMALLLDDESDYYGNRFFWQWLLHILISVTYIYNLSVLAGVIAGTVLTHLLLALFLNGLLPVMVYLFHEIIIEFWTGFYSLPLASSDLSPLSHYWEEGGYYRIYAFFGSEAGIEAPAALYLLAALLFLLAAWMLYRRLKVEREGESAVFKGFGELVCVLLGLVGLCACGMLLHLFGESGEKALFFTGAAAGGLVFYIAGLMLLEKRVQIFTRANLKKIGVFALCGAMLCSFLVFDLGGFAGRLPETSEIAAVQADHIYGLDGYAYLSDPALIEKGRTLSLTLAAHGKSWRNAAKYDDSIFFTYYLDKDWKPEYNLTRSRPKIIQRSYAFDPAQPDIAKAYAALFDDPAYKKLSPLYDLEDHMAGKEGIPINREGIEPGYEEIMNPDDIKAIARAIQADFRAMTYEDHLAGRSQNKAPVITLDLPIKDEIGGGISFFHLELRQDYSRTLNELKTRGYANHFHL